MIVIFEFTSLSLTKKTALYLDSCNSVLSYQIFIVCFNKPISYDYITVITIFMVIVALSPDKICKLFLCIFKNTKTFSISSIFVFCYYNVLSVAILKFGLC